MTLKESAKKLKLTIPVIYLCLTDPDTPKSAKILAWLTVGYALSPVDLIPDFIPILGYLDDVLILPALAALTRKRIPKEIYEKHRAEAEDLWEEGKPKNWKYAIPIVLFWLIILFLILKAFL